MKLAESPGARTSGRPYSRNMVRRARAVLAAFLALSLVPLPVRAAYDDVGTSARITGMSNSYTAVADDVYSTYYNPAGLATLPFGVAFENVFDHERDIPTHITRTHQQENPAGHTHRPDQGQGHDDAVQLLGRGGTRAGHRVGDRAQQHASGETTEHE